MNIEDHHHSRAFGSDLRMNRRKILGTMGVLAFSLLPKTGKSESLLVNKGKVESQVLSFGTLIDAKESLKVSAGTIVKTFGYYTLGDGGSGTYFITKNTSQHEPNEGDVIQFPKMLIGLLIDVEYVSYRMFGAVGDGINDDGIQIKAAHSYANRHGIPVRNLTGEYWIEKERSIQIQTSVEFGNTIFHINEKYNTKSPVFNVISYDKPQEINVSDAVKRNIIESIKPGTQIIPELKDYPNSLILIKDDNDRIGFRAGDRYAGQSRAKEELFYVEEGGKILGDIAWAFNDYTDLTAYSAEKSYLIINGGTFFLSGDSHPEMEKKGYFQNGFSVTRSRTIIQNQWVGLEPGKSDIAYNPRNGFYGFNTVYEVLLENIRLIPWEQDRPGTEMDLYAGTYGIGGNRMLNSTFRNITAEGTLLHWGVFGTNMNKNFRIENCRLNRVDVHFHCWNLTIKDTQIGNRGISITGGGELIIENTSCESQQFVNFRRDFGAKWEGNISIKNCRLKPLRARMTSILYFIAGDFDYRYPIGLANTIHVENFIIDYTSIPNNSHQCWLIKASNFSVSQKGERLFFPSSLIFKNISVQGREKGVRLMELPDPAGFSLHKNGGYDGVFIKYNALIQFDNVQLEDISSDDKDFYHFQFKTTSKTLVYDKKSLYPKIIILNCGALSANFAGFIAEVFVEKSVVNYLQATNEEQMPGELTFSNCKFLPTIFDIDVEPYGLSTVLGTSFINCVFLLPRVKNEQKPELLSLLSFIKVNETVCYSHLNSRLGNDILSFLKSTNTKLNKSFIAKLKNHHELED